MLKVIIFVFFLIGDLLMSILLQPYTQFGRTINPKNYKKLFWVFNLIFLLSILAAFIINK